MQLALDPLACRELLGVRAGELGLLEDADAVLGPVAERLREQVAEAGSWPAAFDVVRAVLTQPGGVAPGGSVGPRDGVGPAGAEAGGGGVYP